MSIEERLHHIELRLSQLERCDLDALTLAKVINEVIRPILREEGTDAYSCGEISLSHVDFAIRHLVRHLKGTKNEY